MKELKNFITNREKENEIDNNLFKKYEVKKGLRNEDGTGVLVGLTKIADVVGYYMEDGHKHDCEGRLFYRGVDVADIVKNESQRFLFEETCFLILFGYLPNEKELESFKTELAKRYVLPKGYLEARLLGFPSKNLMNKLQQEVLMLYCYDHDADNISVDATMDKGLDLIAKIPSIVCYAYRSKVHFYDKESLFIHQIHPELSIAENILHLLRDNKEFTASEAYILDLCLVLHADHGGGNNSTFTNVVISSTGTDIYSSFAGAIGSLKGPRHGGANLAVKKQMETVLNVMDCQASDQEIEAVVCKILDGSFNDNSGLVYGIGHAVYTKSDPRCQLLSKQCHLLAIEKGREEEYLFYQRFEKIAIETIYQKKGVAVCANVDFYSGFIYDMLEIPSELYTLMFVIGRTVGWLAHNIENKLFSNRIIRPAAKYVGDKQEYKDRDKRS
ncbi:citrate synthase [Tannockella kyphosi]|uniref:citrate synthase n=1 Tax=Tannockella kyphosi TaxID=2899121 RepID=UPI00201109B0|nr:citrate synthase [Tannockella kyphosi]